MLAILRIFIFLIKAVRLFLLLFWNEDRILTFFFIFLNQMGKAQTGWMGNYPCWARGEDKNTVLSPSPMQSSFVKLNLFELLSSCSLRPELMLSVQRAQQLGPTNARVTALLPWDINWHSLYLQHFDNLWQLVIDLIGKCMVYQINLLIFVGIRCLFDKLADWNGVLFWTREMMNSDWTVRVHKKQTI